MSTPTCIPVFLQRGKGIVTPVFFFFFFVNVVRQKWGLQLLERFASIGAFRFLAHKR